MCSGPHGSYELSPYALLSTLQMCTVICLGHLGGLVKRPNLDLTSDLDFEVKGSGSALGSMLGLEPT